MDYDFGLYISLKLNKNDSLSVWTDKSYSLYISLKLNKNT